MLTTQYASTSPVWSLSSQVAPVQSCPHSGLCLFWVASWRADTIQSNCITQICCSVRARQQIRLRTNGNQFSYTTSCWPNALKGWCFMSFQLCKAMARFIWNTDLAKTRSKYGAETSQPAKKTCIIHTYSLFREVWIQFHNTVPVTTVFIMIMSFLVTVVVSKKVRIS